MLSSRSPASSPASSGIHNPTSWMVDNRAQQIDANDHLCRHLGVLDDGLSDVANNHAENPDSDDGLSVHTPDHPSFSDTGLSDDGLSVEGFNPENRPANLPRNGHRATLTRGDNPGSVQVPSAVFVRDDSRARARPMSTRDRAPSPSPIDRIQGLHETLRLKNAIIADLEQALDRLVEESDQKDAEINTLRRRIVGWNLREQEMAARDAARMMSARRGSDDSW